MPVNRLMFCCEDDFLKLLDEESLKYGLSRSAFIRLAVAEKVDALKKNRI